MAARSDFRPELQGLRAVAALLVAIYHIWLGRVSGGVDVFFVVSGFLVVGSLLRQVERSGRIDIPAFWGGLLKRLLPLALLVLAAVLLASLLWLPKVRWAETSLELLASALYAQNWLLAHNAIDYLAQNNAASPVQHFWALSIQGQNYLLWPLLIAAAVLLCKRLDLRLRPLLSAVLAGVFLLSLAYSVFATRQDQAFAYFNTFARIWEFTLGGMLALVAQRLQPSRMWAVLLGWGGLVAILACGLVFEVSTVFPGYAALWPTLAAAAVIVAAGHGGRWGVQRLLASRPMVGLGDASYALYLWHWPILVFWLLLSNRTEAGLVDGGLILLGSVLLAIVSTRWFEQPVRRYGGPGRPRAALALNLAMLLSVLIALSAFWFHVDTGIRAATRLLLDDPTYPGALAMHPDLGLEVPASLPTRPPPLAAKDDLPSIYRSRCHQHPRNPEPKYCSFGNDEAGTTIALVGGSHAAHWLPALERIVENTDWRVLNFTKSGCRFTATPRGHPSCPQWNAAVMDVLRELRPVLVITTATLGIAEDEHVPPGYLEHWRHLDEAGIGVVAIRDNPRPGFDAPECVERHGADASDCWRERAQALAVVNPIEQLESPPDNVRFVDFSDFFCNADHCPSVIGNILVYRDHHHLTATFARSLASILKLEIEAALDD